MYVRLLRQGIIIKVLHRIKYHNNLKADKGLRRMWMVSTPYNFPEKLFWRSLYTFLVFTVVIVAEGT